jgi:predicted nuclease of restriction endonuclease-like (RecB) superfamily
MKLTKSKSAALLNQIRALILNARQAAGRSIDLIQVWTNFHIGRLIVEDEQKGEKRADYAARTLPNLSVTLTEEFGRGFAERNLEYMRQFYILYRSRISQSPIAKSAKKGSWKLLISRSIDHDPISQSLIAKSSLPGIFRLSWTHYLFLMSVDDPDERSFYEIEAAAQNWSVRELRRQFGTSLYERLSLSRNKAQIRELSRRGQVVEKPEDAIKRPVVLDFLGLDEKAGYTETSLELAIINRIEHFLLEMGKGFLFEARQKRLSLNDKHFYVDLVLYNRLLRCYVLVDLKIGELTHQDIGQMQMYVNYFDRKIRTKDENLTVGIILCKKKDDALVEITLPENNKQIFAGQYKLFLPSKAQLRAQIVKVVDESKDRA